MSDVREHNINDDIDETDEVQARRLALENADVRLIDWIDETDDVDEIIQIIREVDDEVDDEVDEDIETVEDDEIDDTEMNDPKNTVDDETDEIRDCIELDECDEIRDENDDATHSNIDEIDETDTIDENDEDRQIVEKREFDDVEWLCDENDETQNEFTSAIDERDEMQSQMSIDSTWTRDVFETVVWIEDDELDERDEIDVDPTATRDSQIDDVDEIEQIDDRWLSHTIVCLKNDVSTWDDERDDCDDEHTLANDLDVRDLCVNVREQIEQIDESYSIHWIRLQSKIFKCIMIPSMIMQIFCEQIQMWNQVFNDSDKKLLWDIRKKTFQKHRLIERLQLKKQQKISIQQHLSHWACRLIEYIISAFSRLIRIEILLINKKQQFLLK